MSTDTPPDSDRWPLVRRRELEALDRLLADVAMLTSTSNALRLAIDCAERARALRYGPSVDRLALMPWLRDRAFSEAREDITAKEGPKA